MNITSSLTEIQNQASNPNFSVWVSASAGSGKTTILKNRYLRLLLEGVESQKILCITYTNAGSDEMKGRILSEIESWQNLNNEDLVKTLSKITGSTANTSQIKNARDAFLKIINEKDAFNIKTIHSFCQGILKKFPFEAEISVNFTVIDSTKQNELIKLAFERTKQNFLSDENFIESVKVLKNQLDVGSIDDFLENFSKSINHISKAIKDNNFLQTVEKKLQVDYNPIALPKQQVLALIQQKHHQTINDFYDKKDEKTFNNYFKIFITTKGTINEKIKDEILINEANRVLEIKKKLSVLKIFEFTKAFSYLAKAIITEYEDIKKYYGYVDFEDQIQKTLKLLSDSKFSSWITYKLDSTIEHILLDEAQDTSPSQWQIINALTQEFFSGNSAVEKDRTLFVVGDEKQSIFSFQGANVDIFKENKIYYLNLAKNSGKFFFEKKLDTSFRSSPVILNVVDCVFEKTKLNNWHQEINHKAFRQNAFGKVVLMKIVEGKASNKKPENIDQLLKFLVTEDEFESYHQQFANKVSLFIKKKLEENKSISKKDFMLLYRTNSRIVPYFQKAFLQHKLSFHGASELTLNESIEIAHLINFTKAMLNLNDDFCLAGVLKSPIFNLNFADLKDLCTNRSGLLINEIKNKKPAFFEEILLFSQMALSQDAYSFFFNLLFTQNYIKNFSEKYSDAGRNIILQFLEEIKNLDFNHTLNLQTFLDFFQKNQFKIKNSKQENDDAIKMLTIHSAKGLQSKIVFLLDTYNDKEESRLKNIVVSEQNCFFIPSIADARACQYVNNLMQENKEYEDLEEKRLLYVALTRSEDELYILGRKVKDEKQLSEKTWYKIIQEAIYRAKEKNPHLELNNSFKEDEFEQLAISNSIENTSYNIDVQKDITDTSYLLNIDEINFSIPKKYQEVQKAEDKRAEDKKQNLNSFSRGRKIHYVLSKISTPKISKKETERLLENISFSEKNLADKIYNLVQSYPFIFEKNSYPEQEVIVNINGDVNLIRIDRLIIDEPKKQIIIIDFKTDLVLLEAVPEEYKNQLQNYKNAIKLKYQDFEIKTYICSLEDCKLSLV